MRALLALLVGSLRLAHRGWRGRPRRELSQSDFTVDGATVRALVVFAKPDAARLGHMDPNQDGVVTAAELEASRSVFRTLVARRDGGHRRRRPLRPDARRGGDVEGDGFGLSIAFACAAPPRRLTISMDVVRRLLPGHQQILHLRAADLETDAVLTATDPRFEWSLEDAGGATATTPARPPLWGAIRLGVAHILTGWDHLLFLLALLLGTRGTRPIVLAVSAFTVAHSITLALAALDVVAPSPGSSSRRSPRRSPTSPSRPRGGRGRRIAGASPSRSASSTASASRARSASWR